LPPERRSDLTAHEHSLIRRIGIYDQKQLRNPKSRRAPELKQPVGYEVVMKITKSRSAAAGCSRHIQFSCRHTVRRHNRTSSDRHGFV